MYDNVKSNMIIKTVQKLTELNNQREVKPRPLSLGDIKLI